MTGTTTLITRREGGVARVRLNRPAVHNAFDDALIRELTDTLQALEREPEIRVVVLEAEGRSFSAGADLNWMRRMAAYDWEENFADSRNLGRLMSTLYELDRPTVARVNGAAIGGGVGLVACCDIAVAADSAVFALSEVRLGLIPAVIAPYVVAAIGERQARRYFTTAERFDAATAERMELVHTVVPAQSLDAAVDDIIGRLLAGGPDAVRAAKRLVRDLARTPLNEATVADTARRIADRRASPEGREGVAAFLEKRPPAWRS